MLWQHDKLKRVKVTLPVALMALADVMQKASDRQATEHEWFRSHLDSATKRDLEKLGNQIMSQISEFVDRVNARFDELHTQVDGIADDVTFLKEEIARIQSSPGPLSPEDEASLAALETRLGQLTTKVADLNSATSRPPTPPA